MPETILQPDLVWGIVPRAIGLLYAVAFASLARQVLPLVGSRGIAPLAQRFDRMARDYPGVRRWFDRPTVFWLCRRDAFLALVPWIGVAAGCAAIVGGEVGHAGLLVCWICWLSLDVCSLWLPWDTMLFEAGFLAIFLPTVPALPHVEATTLPLVSVAFLFQWLVIRLMLGFAKLKFLGTEKGDGLYLQGFLTWLPMPTPLGWILQHGPRLALRLGFAFMFLAEVVAPLLALIPGPPRLIAAALLAALMVGIGATGNWGHFNLGYLLLCLTLLDTQLDPFDLSLAASSPADLAVHAVMTVLFVLGLVFFPLNSWVTQSWTQWNFDALIRRRRWLRPAIAALRFLNHFRIVGSYGVFPPNTSPPIKMVPVIQGSMDGERWTPIPWKFMPTGPDRPPRWIAPHHPRLDHSSIYTGLGLTESDSVGGLMFELKPYGVSPYGPSSWLERLVQRILEGDRGVGRLLGPNPFASAPPTWVRVVHECLRPTTLAERRKTGRWWHARTMSVLFPPTRREPAVLEQWIAPPECMHPDLTHWRRRSPALRAMLRRFEEGADLRATLTEASSIRADAVARYFEAFVPFVADPARRDRWDRIAATHAELAREFDAATRHVLERIHQRTAWLLHRALEAALERSDSPPPFPPPFPTSFHAQVAVQALQFDGEERVRRYLAHPEEAIDRARSFAPATLLYPTAVFRWPMVRFVALTLRSRTLLSRAPEMPFGIGHFREFLLSIDVGDPWFPRCERHPDGSWTVDAAQFTVETFPTAATQRP